MGPVGPTRAGLCSEKHGPVKVNSVSILLLVANHRSMQQPREVNTQTGTYMIMSVDCSVPCSCHRDGGDRVI